MNNVEIIDRIEDIQFMPHPIMPNKDMEIESRPDSDATLEALKEAKWNGYKVAVFHEVYRLDGENRLIYKNAVNFDGVTSLDIITVPYGYDYRELVVKSAALHRIEVLVIGIGNRSDEFKPILEKYPAFKKVIFAE